MRRAVRLVAIAFLATACIESTGTGDGGRHPQLEVGEGSSILGARLELPESADARVEARQAVEEAVAACMKERGFDYTPWNYAPGAPETAIGGLVPRSDDFIRQYGFGRSTLRYSIDDVPDDIVGYPGGLSEREQVDPNLQAQATVEGFGEALFGRIDDAGSTTDGPEPCIVVGERNADVFGTAADDDSRRAITVYTEYAESVAQLAFASEQWRSHIEEIADCISAEGFDEAGSRLLGAEPDRGSFWALEDFASERYEPLLVDGDPEGDWGVVRQLQEWELGLARAAASCDYFEMETAHRVIGQNFEPLVEAEMEGELVWLAGYLAERRS